MIREFLFNIGLRGFNGTNEKMEESKQRALRGLYRNLRNPKTDSHNQDRKFLEKLQVRYPADVVFYSQKDEERTRVTNVEELKDALGKGPSTELENTGYKIVINSDINEQYL